MPVKDFPVAKSVKSFDLPVEVDPIYDANELLQRSGLDRSITAADLLDGEFDLINVYRLDMEIPCGLADCRTPHKSGLLGKLADGRLFHVGRVCGKTKLGHDFAIAQRKLEATQNEIRLRRDITAFVDDVPVKRRGVQDLVQQERGASWVRKALQEWKRVTPDGVREVMRQKARSNDSKVERVRQRSQDEIRDLLDAGLVKTRSDGEYESELIGNFQGLNVLLADPHRDHKLITNNLESLENLNVASLGLGQLRAWKRWIVETDEATNRLRHAIEAGSRFFTPENLALQVEVASTDDDARTLRETTWQLAVPQAIAPQKRVSIMSEKERARQHRKIGGRRRKKRRAA
ncbi:hypothetical protein [Natronocella acetinitrilica]|nr:hypothetical protein [Natronocella acetinitrilica]